MKSNTTQDKKRPDKTSQDKNKRDKTRQKTRQDKTRPPHDMTRSDTTRPENTRPGKTTTQHNTTQGQGVSKTRRSSSLFSFDNDLVFSKRRDIRQEEHMLTITHRQEHNKNIWKI